MNDLDLFQRIAAGSTASNSKQMLRLECLEEREEKNSTSTVDYSHDHTIAFEIKLIPRVSNFHKHLN